MQKQRLYMRKGQQSNFNTRVESEVMQALHSFFADILNTQSDLGPFTADGQ